MENIIKSLREVFDNVISYPPNPHGQIMLVASDRDQHNAETMYTTYSPVFYCYYTSRGVLIKAFKHNPKAQL